MSEFEQAVISSPPPAAPHPVDVYVGSRLKAARKASGVSQSGLGRVLGVTFQQVQKYEKGANRLSASMLVEACRALHVRPEDLLPDMKDVEVKPLTAQIDTYPGGAELADRYAKMSASRRRLLLRLAEVFAEDEGVGPCDP